jgi:folate-binding protein YgfZ
VELSDATKRLALFSVPGSAEVAELPDAARAFRPSPLGPGVGLLVERSVASDVARGLRATMPVATADAVERWRVAAAVPLFGTDFDAGALPAEAGLESAIDFTKGCFLGQESVAKVRNLGHPQTVIVALHAPSGVTRGDGVYANGTAVGTVTSAASVPDDGTVLLARIRWEARNEDLSTGAGVAVSLREVNATQT